MIIPLYKVPGLVLTYKPINYLFYEITHDVSDRKYITIGKTINLSY